MITTASLLVSYLTACGSKEEREARRARKAAEREEARKDTAERAAVEAENKKYVSRYEGQLEPEQFIEKMGLKGYAASRAGSSATPVNPQGVAVQRTNGFEVTHTLDSYFVIPTGIPTKSHNVDGYVKKRSYSGLDLNHTDQTMGYTVQVTGADFAESVYTELVQTRQDLSLVYDRRVDPQKDNVPPSNPGGSRVPKSDTGFPARQPSEPKPTNPGGGAKQKADPGTGVHGYNLSAPDDRQGFGLGFLSPLTYLIPEARAYTPLLLDTSWEVAFLPPSVYHIYHIYHYDNGDVKYLTSMQDDPSESVDVKKSSMSYTFNVTDNNNSGRRASCTLTWAEDGAWAGNYANWGAPDGLDCDQGWAETRVWERGTRQSLGPLWGALINEAAQSRPN